MENFKSFEEAKAHFSGIWAPERKQVIKDLTNIKDEIQKQTRIHSIGAITYSSVGVVGGGLTIAGIVAAPFTFGASLALSAAGIATGVASGVAGVTHGAVKFGIIKSKCDEAKTSLEKHAKTTKEMIRLVAALKVEIDKFELEIKRKFETSHVLNGIRSTGGAAGLPTGIAALVNSSRAAHVYRVARNTDEVARILSLNKKLADLVPSALKDVSTAGAKISTKALTVFAAIGIIFDLGSLIYNAVDLSKMEKGKLCQDAEKLEKVIKDLQKEFDVLSECFS